ncbi:T9SS type A sorting domain-containing protein, partial [Urechidicola vernalis]
DNDIDGDGVCGDIDNCPTTYNLGQEDADNDGIGDVCDVEEGVNSFKSAEASAFPVPSDTLVKIEYSFSYDTTVSILIVDYQGKTVHHVSGLNYLKDTSGVYQYDVTYLSSGVYFAIITTSNSDDKLEVKILRGTN